MSRMVVGEKEEEGMVNGRRRFRVKEGKMVQAMMPGMLRRASARKAVWIMEGIVGMVVYGREGRCVDGLYLILWWIF